MTSRRNEDIIPQEEDAMGKTFSRRASISGGISAVMKLGNRSLAANVCHLQYLDSQREHFSGQPCKTSLVCCKLKQENADFLWGFLDLSTAQHIPPDHCAYETTRTDIELHITTCCISHTSNRGHHRPCCMWPWRSKVEPTTEFHGVGTTSGADLRESHRSGSR